MLHDLLNGLVKIGWKAFYDLGSLYTQRTIQIHGHGR